MTVNWGIAATGGIATKFAEDLALVDDAELVAVASRTAARAEQFGTRFGAPHRHGSYADLAADGDVEVVYVASPQSEHHRDAITFLEAGKHVLCEKPFALNATQATEMLDAARRNGVFCMEALWSRFLPPYVRLRELLADGRIGSPLLVDSDFGLGLPFDPGHRLYDLARGGGALLDLGIYPLQLATMVLGEPTAVIATGDIGSTGVDETTIAVVTHADGGRSVCKTSVRAALTNRARIAGSDGAIELPAPAHCPSSIEITSGDTIARIDTSFDGNGLRFQVPEVHARIAAGEQESPVMPWSETLRLARLMDDIRAQIGMRYDVDA